MTNYMKKKKKKKRLGKNGRRIFVTDDFTDGDERQPLSKLEVKIMKLKERKKDTHDWLHQEGEIDD